MRSLSASMPLVTRCFVPVSIGHRRLRADRPRALWRRRPASLALRRSVAPARRVFERARDLQCRVEPARSARRPARRIAGRSAVRASPLSGGEIVEDLRQDFRRQVFVVVVIDLRHRRVHAGAQAFDLAQRERAVRRDVDTGGRSGSSQTCITSPAPRSQHGVVPQTCRWKRPIGARLNMM